MRWDTGVEKMSSFAWREGQILTNIFQNKSRIFLKQAKITTVAPFGSENSDFLMKLKKNCRGGQIRA